MIDQIPKPLFDMGESIKFNLKQGHILASIILMYCYINAIASSIMPKKQKDVKGVDFINWVEKYMKAENQPYQYKGIDLWEARCGLVHRYQPHSSLSDRGACKLFCYRMRKNHVYDPSKSENVVIISAPRIVRDFYGAMSDFMGDLLKDKELRERADRRFRKFFQVIDEADLPRMKRKE